MSENARQWTCLVPDTPCHCQLEKHFTCFDVEIRWLHILRVYPGSNPLLQVTLAMENHDDVSLFLSLLFVPIQAKEKFSLVCVALDTGPICV